MLRRSKRQQGIDLTPEVVVRQNKKCQKAVDEAAKLDHELAGKNHGEEEEAESKEQNGEKEEEEQNGEKEDLEDKEEEEKEDEEVVSEPVQKEPGQPSTEEFEPHQSVGKKRRTRGPTKMRRVATHHDDKVNVDFTSVGEHVGTGSVTLSSFLGPLVREHVPYLLDNWRHISDQTRDTLWEEIQVLFLSFTNYL